MCNEYQIPTKWEEYEAMMRHVDLGIVGARPELPTDPDIRIGDAAPVIRMAGNGVELVPMRFGFPPPRPKAAPVFNFRSEGRHFEGSNRCLIPATGFYEFTGSKYPKTKHRFWRPDQPWLVIAGLWRSTNAGEAFTMLTTEPGPDIAPIHDRQVVVLEPRQWMEWLALGRPEAELLRPSPEGTLGTEVVRTGAQFPDAIRERQVDGVAGSRQCPDRDDERSGNATSGNPCAPAGLPVGPWSSWIPHARRRLGRA